MNDSIEMPKYRSHKTVHALKIESVTYLKDGGAKITPADKGYAPFEVDSHYLGRHEPKVGGYYVVYKDGYKSFSPAAAFEEGYTLIEK